MNSDFDKLHSSMNHLSHSLHSRHNEPFLPMLHLDLTKLKYKIYLYKLAYAFSYYGVIVRNKTTNVFFFFF